MGYYEETVIAAAQSLVATTTPGATSPQKAEDTAHASGAVGTFLLGVRNDTASTTFTSADSDYSPVAVDDTGAVFTKNRPTRTTIGPIAFTPQVTNQQLLASNTTRRGAIIVNRSGQDVFLRFGATAATTALYSDWIANNTRYELPFDITGAVQMIAGTAGTAGLFVTEIRD